MNTSQLADAALYKVATAQILKGALKMLPGKTGLSWARGWGAKRTAQAVADPARAKWLNAWRLRRTHPEMGAVTPLAQAAKGLLRSRSMAGTMDKFRNLFKSAGAARAALGIGKSLLQKAPGAGKAIASKVPGAAQSSGRFLAKVPQGARFRDKPIRNAAKVALNPNLGRYGNWTKPIIGGATAYAVAKPAYGAVMDTHQRLEQNLGFGLDDIVKDNYQKAGTKGVFNTATGLWDNYANTAYDYARMHLDHGTGTQLPELKRKITNLVPGGLRDTIGKSLQDAAHSTAPKSFWGDITHPVVRPVKQQVGDYLNRQD